MTGFGIKCNVPNDCPDNTCQCGCDKCVTDNGHYERREQVDTIRRYGLSFHFFNDLFHWKTGFLRDDGCVLPRMFRSRICNNTICKEKNNG